MKYFILLNALGLSIVNLFFLFAGTFLNTVVILSIWKSSQLRKKLCYFMILVLSSIDLLVVIFIHPLLIVWSNLWYFEDSNILVGKEQDLLILTGTSFVVSSQIGLFTMTLERYMGLAYPLFHKTTITKRKMIIVLAGLHSFALIIDICTFVLGIATIANYFALLFLALSVVLAVLMNYKIVLIAKSRNKNTHLGNSRKNMQSKRYYACVLAVVSFILCCCPASIFYSLILAGLLTNTSNVSVCLFHWSATIVTINSTINSLIFFWMNNALRSEGKKLIKTYGILKS